jgi:group I intron endonuclease
MHRSLLARGKHHSVKLQRSWAVHGESAFSFEVLEEVISMESLIDREQYWIDFLNAIDPLTGFNVAPTAGSSLGRKHPPEVIAKMRGPRRKMPPRSPEHCAAISTAKMGKPVLALRGPRPAALGKNTGPRGPNPAVSESNRRRKGEKKPGVSIAMMGNKHGSKQQSQVQIQWDASP